MLFVNVLDAFGEASDVARERVDFEVDQVTNFSGAPCGRVFGVGDEIDPEACALDLVDGERCAVQSDGAFGRDEACELFWGFERDAGAVTFVFHGGDARDAIDMARDDMTAKLIADFERALKIDATAFNPCADVGFRHAFGGDLNVKPSLAQRYGCEADAVAGDGGADINCFGVIRRADARAQVAALLKLKNGDDICDDACEHGAAFRADGFY